MDIDKGLVSAMVNQLDAITCHKIVWMRQDGSTQSDIARDLGISQGTVSKVLKRNRDFGTPLPRPRPGRPRKTTVRADRQLIRLCRNGRRKSANMLRAEWLPFLVAPVSRELVNKRLIKAGYFARRTIKKPRIIA